MGKKFMNTALFLAVTVAAATLTAYVGKGSGNVLLYNFTFLGLMLIIYAVGLFAGLYRMDNLSRALKHGAGEITEVFQLPGRARKEEIGQLRGIFGDRYLDKKMDDFVDSISRTEEGIAEVEDFVNIEDVDVHIHKRLLEMAPDIFTSLGNPKDNLRDRFILSKGHCVEALYVTLESRGFMAKGILDTLGQYGSILSGHPTIGVPGIEVNTGALGHGLSVGVGIAMAAKMDKRNYKTYVLMGDGEQGEGSIYEAAMAARQYKLDNLVAVIDRNHLQISGDTEDVMGIDDIRDRWTAFGWEVKDMNGDDMEDIIRTFRSIDYANHHPHLLVAHTTKGKGVSFMEGVAKWHHGVPNNEQYELAIREISERIKNLEYN